MDRVGEFIDRLSTFGVREAFVESEKRTTYSQIVEEIHIQKSWLMANEICRFEQEHRDSIFSKFSD